MGVVGLLVWRVLKQHYQGRLDTKDDLIKLRDGQVQDYKDKLSGATPDEARQQIEALRTQVERLTRQRTLTAEQKKAITEAATGRSFPGSRIDIIYVPSSHETVVFATDIAEALQKAGWPVQADYTMDGGTQRLHKRGLNLAVNRMAKRSAMVMALGEALEKAGVSFTWEESPGSLQSSGRLYVDLAD